MKSKIAQLDASALSSTLAKVEAALASASKLTKAVVKRTLAQDGLCSESSTGVEQTLLAAAQRHSVGIPAKFAELMGVIASEGEKFQPAEGNNSPETAETPVLLNLKALSMLSISPTRATGSFVDGTPVSIGNFDESAFRSSCNLIEFNVSSK
jgi:hypothetical protein